METTEKKILVFTSSCHFFTHFYMLIFPVLLLPMTRSLGLPLEQVLPKSFFMYLLYGLLAMPWGFMGDRFSPRIVMGSGIILAGVGFCLTAIIKDLRFLTVTLALVGVGCAAYHPSGLALISKGLRARGRGMGINGLFGNLGIAGAPFAAGILNYLVGWQLTFLILGIMGLVVGSVSLVVPFSVDRNNDRQSGTEISKESHLKLFISLCLVMTVNGLMFRAFTLILPSLMEVRLADTFIRFFGESTAPSTLFARDKASLYAAIITGVAYLIGMAGQIVGGTMADRKELKVTYLIYFASALPFLLLLRFLDGPILMVLAGLFAFFTMGMQPIENSLYSMLTPARWRSLAFGLKFTLVFGIGSLSVFLVNLVDQRWGISSVVTLILFYLVGVILLAAVLNILGRKQSIRHTTHSA